MVSAGVTHGVSLDQLGDVAKSATSAVIAAFSGKGVDQDALAANAVAGVKAGAKAANLPSEIVDKLVKQASEGVDVDTSDLPELAFHGAGGKVAPKEYELSTKATSLTIKVTKSSASSVDTDKEWSLLAPTPASAPVAEFLAAKDMTKFRWAFIDSSKFYTSGASDDEGEDKEWEGTDGGSDDEGSDGAGFDLRKQKQPLKKISAKKHQRKPVVGKPVSDKLLKRRAAIRAKDRSKRVDASDGSAKELKLAWSDWLPFAEQPTVSLSGKSEGDYYVMIEVVGADGAEAFRNNQRIVIDRTPPTLVLRDRAEYEAYLDDLWGDDEEPASDEYDDVSMPKIYTDLGYGEALRYVIVPDPSGNASCSGAGMPPYFGYLNDEIDRFESMPATASSFVDLWQNDFDGERNMFNSRPILICAEARDDAGNKSTVAMKRYTPQMHLTLRELDAPPASLDFEQGASVAALDGQSDVLHAGTTTSEYVVAGLSPITFVKRTLANGAVSGAVTVFENSDIADWDTYGTAMAANGNNIYVAITGAGGVVLATSTDAGANWTHAQIVNSGDMRSMSPAIALTTTHAYVYYGEASGDDGEDTRIKQAKAPIDLSAWTVSSVRLYPDNYRVDLAASASGSQIYMTVIPRSGEDILFLERSSNSGGSFSQSVPTLPLVHNLQGDAVVVENIDIGQPKVIVNGTRAVILTRSAILTKTHSATVWTAAGYPQALFKNGDSFPPPPGAGSDDGGDDAADGDGDGDEWADEPGIHLPLPWHLDQELLFWSLDLMSVNYNGSVVTALFRSYDDDAPYSAIIATSTDFGATWTSKRAGNDVAEGLAVYASNSHISAWYKDTLADKVRVLGSTDLGVTWNSVTTPKSLVGQVLSIQSVCCDMLGAGQVGATSLALTSDGSLVRSADSGVTWETAMLSHRLSVGKFIAAGGKFVMGMPGWFLVSTDGLTWNGRVAAAPSSHYHETGMLFMTESDADVVTQAYVGNDYDDNTETVVVAQYDVGSDTTPVSAAVASGEGAAQGIMQAHGAAYAKYEVVTDESDPPVTQLLFKRFELNGVQVGSTVTLDEGTVDLWSMNLLDTSAGLLMHDGTQFVRHNGASWSTAGALTGDDLGSLIFADGKPWIVRKDSDGLKLLRTADGGANWSVTVVDDFDGDGEPVLLHDGSNLQLFYLSRYGVGVHRVVSTDDGASF